MLTVSPTRLAIGAGALLAALVGGFLMTDAVDAFVVVVGVTFIGLVASGKTTNALVIAMGIAFALAGFALFGAGIGLGNLPYTVAGLGPVLMVLYAAYRRMR